MQLISYLLIAGLATLSLAGEHRVHGARLSSWFSSKQDSKKIETPAVAEPGLSQPAVGEHLPPAKSNKVSKLLHLMSDKASEYVYATEAPDTKDDGDDKGVKLAQHDWASMSDIEVIKAACDDSLRKSVCQMAANRALAKKPEKLAEIAARIRSKPAHVKASKVLYHSLLRHAVDSIESRKYDEKLDKLINVAVARNPYGLIAMKAIDWAI